ncbi:hypothetical protein GCM10028833_16530 [Glycomyces tarimensis]
MSVVVDDQGFAGSGFGDGPAGGVGAAVVEPAQQDQVLGYCRPTIRPVADVVGFGPLHRCETTGPGAPAGLLEFQLPPQGAVGQAQGAAELDRFTGAVVEHVGDHEALAGEQAGLPEGDGVAFQGGDASGVLPGQRFDVDRQVQDGGVPVPLGRVRVGAMGRDHLVERLSAAVRRRRQRPVLVDFVLPGRGHGGGQELGEQLPGVGRQEPGEDEHAILSLD